MWQIQWFLGKFSVILENSVVLGGKYSVIWGQIQYYLRALKVLFRANTVVCGTITVVFGRRGEDEATAFHAANIRGRGR